MRMLCRGEERRKEREERERESEREREREREREEITMFLDCSDADAFGSIRSQYFVDEV